VVAAGQGCDARKWRRVVAAATGDQHPLHEAVAVGWGRDMRRWPRVRLRREGPAAAHGSGEHGGWQQAGESGTESHFFFFL